MPIEWLTATPGTQAVLVTLHHSHEGQEAEKTRVLPHGLSSVPVWSEFERVLDHSSWDRLTCAIRDRGPASLVAGPMAKRSLPLPVGDHNAVDCAADTPTA